MIEVDLNSISFSFGSIVIIDLNSILSISFALNTSNIF